MKQRNQMNDEAAYFYRRWYELPNDEMIHPAAEQEIEAMEAYANHRIKQLLDVSEEEIDDNFSKSPDNHIHPDRYRTEGAKWFRNHILNKLT